MPFVTDVNCRTKRFFAAPEAALPTAGPDLGLSTPPVGRKAHFRCPRERARGHFAGRQTMNLRRIFSVLFVALMALALASPASPSSVTLTYHFQRSEERRVGEES